MLIDVNGDKKGMVTFDEAIKTAQSLSLDLVQVSPKNAEPVVCKILDYGKLVFTKKKNTQSSNSKIKKSSVKEIKFRPSTDTGDYNIKLKKIKKLYS